jgi:hypothetical protein
MAPHAMCSAAGEVLRSTDSEECLHPRPIRRCGDVHHADNIINALHRKLLFELTPVLHPLYASLTEDIEAAWIAQAVMGPAPMRLFTGHRVMQQIVLPGASHVGLIAASYRASQECEDTVFISQVLFVRPYLVSDGIPTEPLADTEMVYASSDDHFNSIADDSDIYEVSAGNSVVASQCAEIATHAFYLGGRGATRGVAFGPRFRSGRSLFCHGSNLFASLHVTNAAEPWGLQSTIAPPLIDGAITSTMSGRAIAGTDSS